jgi:membrane protein DedA with SNARE-associated domain
VATLGSILGTLLWYGLARAWGRERFLRFIDRHGVWLTLTREEAEAPTEWFQRTAPPPCSSAASSPRCAR